MILFIDHYDSFSQTIVDYLRQLNTPVELKKTNDMTLLTNLESYSHIIIGPGPGHPREIIKLVSPVIAYCQESITPLLGICLGHQVIAYFYGANIIQAPFIFHGKESILFKCSENDTLLKDIPISFSVARYHSLIVGSLKNTNLKLLAKTVYNEIMCLKHESYPIFGIQYHPEAYLTEYGIKIFSNFLRIN